MSKNGRLRIFFTALGCHLARKNFSLPAMPISNTEQEFEQRKLMKPFDDFLSFFLFLLDGKLRVTRVRLFNDWNLNVFGYFVCEGDANHPKLIWSVKPVDIEKFALDTEWDWTRCDGKPTEVRNLQLPQELDRGIQTGHAETDHVFEVATSNPSGRIVLWRQALTLTSKFGQSEQFMPSVFHP